MIFTSQSKKLITIL